MYATPVRQDFTTPYYRQAVHTTTRAQAPPPVNDVRDDYERWYTKSSNRMLLSLRSGIHSEIGWSLDRLCRLCQNDNWSLSSIPGLIDALFEWPEWYVTEGYKNITDSASLFSPDPEQARDRLYAIEGLFVLRNAALDEKNVWDVINHSHTLPLAINAVKNLDFEKDENCEFLVHSIDLLLMAASRLIITPAANPIPNLINIAAKSSNRTLIISALTALYYIFSNPAHHGYLSANSAALGAAIRYLPLFVDKPLIDASLNYLYVHLSHPPMAKAFLLHPDMPKVLRVLVNLLITEQIEEKVTYDVTGPIYTVPSTTHLTRDHELTPEEMQTLLELTEPERCYSWMRTMFVAKVDGELTQVDFWNLYKDAFSPYPDKAPLLVASDVIKNVSLVIPQAQAMVLQEPAQRFIVRGVDRRKDPIPVERFKCHWDRSQCSVPAHSSSAELFDHILEHLAAVEATEFPCLWSTCPAQPKPKHVLRSHILTHLSTPQASEKHPSQSDTITLPTADSPYPISVPTLRPVPPPRSTVISYPQPTIDPPPTSLTALLCIRILFRTSFASSEAAPRVDADHFGFPGVVEEPDEQELAEEGEGEALDSELEGEKRGRKAFMSIRRLLEGVRMRDNVLMGWIVEMIDAGITGTTA
ncbi:hypothetical protein BDN72DRAFT_754704 [Pluteus cervinus]|uniref:Uncharacterized protein n=1 Tax=Pluteus cervinus TaxID=181527 RepID=A0ACD3BGW6_9AGAR|nr:hypothetical protein BDN72DRAFT_754704 [Pluteus cervinus]